MIHDIALMIDRQKCDREAEPTAAVLDSQTVKAPYALHRGYDAGKKISGRKRHIAVDADGRLLMVNLTPADRSAAAGAQKVLEAVKKGWPWLKHLFADSAYDRAMLLDKAALLEFVVEIVHKMQDQHTFVPLRRRWVVERSFGWVTCILYSWHIHYLSNTA
jgi:transposase